MTDNELIAQFMGFTCADTGQDRFWNPPGMPFATIYDWKYHSNHLDEFQTSWDWLMPVVEKIASTDEGYWFLITINGRSDNRQTGCSINRGKRAFEPITKDQGNKPLIDTVYQAVVEFIKWYNTQNNIKPFEGDQGATMGKSF